MWSRADLERFYRGFFWVLVVLVCLILAVSLIQFSARAAEVTSPSMMIQHPIVCQDSTSFYNRINTGVGFVLWEGVHNKTFLDRLWVFIDGSYLFTTQRAKSKTICIMSMGEEQQLIGKLN